MIKVEHTKTLEIPLRLLPTMHGLVATRPRTTALVTDAELILVECKLEEALLHRYSDGYLGTSFSSMVCEHLKPIPISRTEKIEVGDPYLMFIDGKYELMEPCADLEEADRCNNHRSISKVCFKILALPEHFSPQQLQDIVDGKLKEGKCLVECEQHDTTKTKKLPYYGTVIKLNPHITIYPHPEQRLENFIKKYKDKVYPVEEKMYTERELEIAYCIGLLNRMLTMEELSIELKTAQDKINRLKESFKRGDFNPR